MKPKELYKDAAVLMYALSDWRQVLRSRHGKVRVETKTSHLNELRGLVGLPPADDFPSRVIDFLE